MTSTYHDDYETPEQSQQRAEDEKARIVADERWREIMGTVGGRACIWPLFVQSHQLQPFANTDPMHLMRAAAERDFMLPLWKQLRRVCPDLLALAEREAQ